MLDNFNLFAHTAILGGLEPPYSQLSHDETLQYTLMLLIKHCYQSSIPL